MRGHVTNYLPQQKTQEHQTRQGADLQWEVPIFKAILTKLSPTSCLITEILLNKNLLFNLSLERENKEERQRAGKKEDKKRVTYSLKYIIDQML